MLPWKCPVCGQKLTPDSEVPRALVCSARHSFDFARQGYINLLLPQKRASRNPGDDPDMVSARTAFLSGGYYEVFSDGVNAMCLEALKEKTDAPLLADAGCGEGYYTKRLYETLLAGYPAAQVLGCDLSCAAVRHGASAAKAAGYAPSLSYAVASLFEIPLADNTCDGIVNLFAPTADAEFARLLKPNGFLLLAVPAERHLYGLKAAVYEKPYENEVRRDALPHFSPESVKRISYEITVTRQEDIAALFRMTPYYFKTSPNDRKKLDALERLTTEVAFDLLLYRKKT